MESFEFVSVFDDEAASFVVLQNGAGQHSLWPVSLQVPAGWTPSFGPASRGDCLGWVDVHWKDMTPHFADEG